MGELRRLLAHTRLLTMLGPGGAGKTRLATEFARAQGHRFADGQIRLELVEVTTQRSYSMHSRVPPASGFRPKKPKTLLLTDRYGR